MRAARAARDRLIRQMLRVAAARSPLRPPGGIQKSMPLVGVLSSAMASAVEHFARRLFPVAASSAEAGLQHSAMLIASDTAIRIQRRGISVTIDPSEKPSIERLAKGVISGQRRPCQGRGPPDASAPSCAKARTQCLEPRIGVLA